MFAFLFDRRSGLRTGLLIAVLAVLLFGGGVLVGLNLRWSKEEVTAGILHPLSLESRFEGDGEPLESDKKAAPQTGVPEAENNGEAPSEDPPPDGWVPMTESAPRPGPST